MRVGVAARRSCVCVALLAPLRAAARRAARRHRHAVDGRRRSPRHACCTRRCRPSGARVRPLEAATLPPVLVAATIAAEDRRFYLASRRRSRVRCVRAARHNLVEGRIVEGGSTITQQVAKLLIQRRDGRAAPRARREDARDGARAAARASLHEARDPRAVPEPRVVRQPDGRRRRASQMYFGVDAGDADAGAGGVSRGAAAAADRVQSASRTSTAAQARQRTVLRRMAAARSADARSSCARRAPSGWRCARGRAPFLAPHFVEMVSGGRRRTPRPPRIETTLDLELQARSRASSNTQRDVAACARRRNVAVVVLDNARGEWLAWEGRATTSTRSIGGAINGPLVAAAARLGAEAVHLRAGVRAGHDTRRRCSPTSRRTFRPPRPACSTARATTTAAIAARCSRGARWPARRTCRRWRSRPTSACRTLLRFLTRAGFTTFDRNAGLLRPGRDAGQRRSPARQLVAAYAMFARGGVWKAPVLLRNASSAAERTVVSPRTAFWITDILSDADARAFIFGRGGRPGVSVHGRGEDRHVAGVSRQLDGRLHARRHRRRLGRQLRSHAAARFIRRHRRGADLSRRDAGGRTPLRHCRPASTRSSPHPPEVQQRRDMCALGDARQCLVPDPRERVVADRRRGAAVLLASSERRRAADDLSPGISRLGSQCGH